MSFSFPTPLTPYRWAIEVALVAIAIGAACLWWHEHNLKEQMVGRQDCEKGIADARTKADKDADARYSKLLKERDDAIDQYYKDKALLDIQHRRDEQQLHDYEDRLRASAVQRPPSAPGHPGPQVVGFTIESFEGFTRTCTDVAKDAQDDALALKMCKTYVDGLPGAAH